jgi:membrane associated rhomboid family serine protease
MFLPLKDINPTVRTPFVTIALIAANVIVYIYQMSLGTQFHAFVASFGATPFEITHMTDLVGGFGVAGGTIRHYPGPSPIILTLMTSMFMHGSLLHLGGNMLYLWIFGNNIEDILGPGRFIIFYLLCGLAAHALHIIVDPSSVIPTVGASGAISGVIGAYLIAFPGARVLSLIFLGFFIRMAIVPAFVIIIFWFVIQLVSAMVSLGGMAGGGVAWFAHIGGFVAGAILIYAMAGDVIRWLRRGGY